MAAAKRDVGRERHWRRLLGQWRRSGVSVREFCQAVEVGESAFYFWRRELLRRDQKAAAANAGGARFVQVRVTKAERPKAEGGIEVALGNGRVVRVRRGFDRDLLLSVVAALEAMPGTARAEDAC